MFEKAETYIRANYDAMAAKRSPNEELIFGDANAKVASMMCRQRKEALAEPFMKRALEIREKLLGILF